MDIKQHLLYQKIISEARAIDYIASVFERVLAETGAWDQQEERACSERAADERGNSAARYRARLFSRFLESVPYEDALEYIDLARKDMLARQMLQYLNVTKGDPQSIKDLLREFCEIPMGRFHVSPNVTLGIRVDLISQFISDHGPYVSIAKNHINMRDVENVLSRSVSSLSQPGMVGGRAAGLILANRILKPTLESEDNELADVIEETDSYFVKSSVAADFVNRNGLQECHSLKYLDQKAMEEQREPLRQRFMAGSFPEHVKAWFLEMLKGTDGTPLVLRSSSYLEDGIEHSFSGKYESVFISNIGSLEVRFEELINGIKRVFWSLYGAHAIEYRRDMNLLDYNERMAVLIQKVIGSRYGKYFFPSVSIVGFSRNAYCWSSRIKPEDGMLRVVAGLGTRATGRVGDDYPRMVSLSAPTLRAELTADEKVKYSQRYIDVFNLETKQIETHNFVALINEILAAGHQIDLRPIISVLEDGMLKIPALPPVRLEHGKCAITFDGLLRNRKFTGLVSRVLKKMEAAYGMPMDMEFVYHDDKLYVLQCRHLLERARYEGAVSMPAVQNEDVIFTVRQGFTDAVVKDIETIVYVDGNAYARLAGADKKIEIARTVGRINKVLPKRTFILMGPGRWGSSNIDLGVPVKYNDINNTRMLIEIAREKGGVTPELSYGTHFFQDLVEADIIPLSLYPDAEGLGFNSEFFRKAKNQLACVDPAGADYEAVVKVIDIPMETGGRRLHVYLDGSASFGAGILVGQR